MGDVSQPLYISAFSSEREDSHGTGLPGVADREQVCEDCANSESLGGAGLRFSSAVFECT